MVRQAAHPQMGVQNQAAILQRPEMEDGPPNDGLSDNEARGLCILAEGSSWQLVSVGASCQPEYLANA
eukprot:354625-Chlamydomonas_euryale.AAC.14